MAEFYIVGAAVMGLIIGLVELFFVHADERGMGWMSHGLHAIPTTLIFTFISMNVPWVLSFSFMSWMPGWAGTYVIPVIIGLIAAIKVKSAAALAQGHGSIGEKMSHALIIGALIAVAPFVWPFVAPYLPSFLQF